jgi:hypothetical protein
MSSASASSSTPSSVSLHSDIQSDYHLIFAYPPLFATQPPHELLGWAARRLLKRLRDEGLIEIGGTELFEHMTHTSPADEHVRADGRKTEGDAETASSSRTGC